MSTVDLCRCVRERIVCWPVCQLMLVAPGKSITLIAVWQSVFMTGDRGALPSMEEKHIDLSPRDLRRLSNLALCTDGHVECFTTESGIDCVEVNGRVIFFCVHPTQPSCHPFFPAICSYDSLEAPQNLLFCLFYLFWMSCQCSAAFIFIFPPITPLFPIDLIICSVSCSLFTAFQKQHLLITQ